MIRDDEYRPNPETLLADLKGVAAGLHESLEWWTTNRHEFTDEDQAEMDAVLVSLREQCRLTIDKLQRAFPEEE